MDRLEVLEKVKMKGRQLKDVDEIYKNDKEIVLAAVK